LLLAGAALSLHFATWIAALQFASVAVATLVVCTTPIFTEAWAIARSGRVRARPLASIGIAVAGVALVVGMPSRTETPAGIALAATGALAMAVYLLLVRASDERYTTLAVVARTFPFACLLLGAAAVLAGDVAPPLDARVAWGGILAMALVSQLFGHTALNAAVRRLSPTFVATTTLLEPAIAALLAALLFHERLSGGTLAGACAILVGIALAIPAASKQR
jgi:drug/metabolite transporter (DMT)-like permease